MRRFLLASAAIAGLTLAALPALAQTQPHIPANPPPVATPQQTPDVTPAPAEPAQPTPDTSAPDASAPQQPTPPAG